MTDKWLLGLAGAALGLALPAAVAADFTEDFGGDPLAGGWQVFGDASLFAWNAADQHLEVTWDSRHTNSYFYRPLGVSLTRYDDFSLEFDLRLSDIASGIEPGKTGPLQIGFGLLNLASATSTNFMRGAWGGAPNVAEFAYYTDGYYDYWGQIIPSPASAVPSFIPETDSYHYAPAFVSVFQAALPTHQTVHVRLAYSGAEQSAVVTLTTNGTPLGSLPKLVLSDAGNSQFTTNDNFHVDTFSISSYSSVGNDYDSVLAHGTVDNVAVTARLQPIGRLTAGRAGNGHWQAQFFAHSNWVYTLEGSADLDAWGSVSAPAAGNESLLVLQDTNAPSPRAFYRVRAQQP